MSTMQERCDTVVGSGDTFLAAGRYKAGDDVKYRYGINISLPDFTDDLKDKIFQIGLHRVMSVKAAGTFNEANEYGSQADAEAFAQQFSSLEGWEQAFEKTRREGGAAKPDTQETLVRRTLAFNAAKKTAEQIAEAGLPEVPLNKAGKPNWAAWAKLVSKDHAWYQKVAKAVAKMEMAL